MIFLTQNPCQDLHHIQVRTRSLSSRLTTIRRPSKGQIKSFSEIADASEKPLILYNVPSRTGCNIPLSVYRQLASHGNIAGIKEASGNVAVSERIIAEFGDKIDVYSGNDELTVPIMSVGGKGVISVVSNILPGRDARNVHLMPAR